MARATKEISRQALLILPATPEYWGMLRLTASGETSDYWFRPIPSELGGHAFEVVKIIPCADGTKMAGNRYHVLINPRDLSVHGCDCVGWGRWNKCRHEYGISTLLRRGLI